MKMEKEKYEKPELEKVEKMTFMFESIKCFKPKQDINCPTSCAHHAPLGCRQCSGCHGCR